MQPDDVRVIRALQVAPRASFASIAAVLGLSEGAVSRRYRRLRADGVIRVAGVVDPGALGQSRWLVRLRCVTLVSGDRLAEPRSARPRR